LEPVQVLEEAKPSASVGRNIDEPSLLPGFRTLAGFSHLLGEGQLARAEEQDSPLRSPARRAVAGGTALAGAAGEHVGDLTDLPRIALPHLVEAEQGITVHFGRAFEPVARGTPLPNEAADPAAATDGTRNTQRSRFAGAARATQVDAAGFLRH